MGPIGIQEMIFIAIFALIVFGPKKLPELGRTFGKGMAEFRRASAELKGTFQREMDNIERETRMDEARKAAQEAKAAITEATNYDDDEDDYYDAYGEKKTSSKTIASSTSSSATEPASSPGDSTDGANASAETPSNDSSSNGVAIAEAVDPPSAGTAEEPRKDPAAEKGAA